MKLVVGEVSHSHYRYITFLRLDTHSLELMFIVFERAALSSSITEDLEVLGLLFDYTVASGNGKFSIITKTTMTKFGAKSELVPTFGPTVITVE